ncbi:MAG: Cell division protein FtsQ, partial [uncultured Actinomycetospora sp.]
HRPGRAPGPGPAASGALDRARRRRPRRGRAGVADGVLPTARRPGRAGRRCRPRPGRPDPRRRRDRSGHLTALARRRRGGRAGADPPAQRRRGRVPRLARHPRGDGGRARTGSRRAGAGWRPARRRHRLRLPDAARAPGGRPDVGPPAGRAPVARRGGHPRRCGRLRRPARHPACRGPGGAGQRALRRLVRALGLPRGALGRGHRQRAQGRRALRAAHPPGHGVRRLDPGPRRRPL